MDNKKKKLGAAAVIALLLASAGGAEFLKRHPNPTIEEIKAACDKGEVLGVVCESDILNKKDFLSSGDQDGNRRGHQGR